jgi:protein-arginine kinase activator protein McsA
MTDKDIEKIAQRVAELLYEKAHTEVSFGIPEEDEEQLLLAELAKAMTLLDSYLRQEQYDKCAIIQNKIKRIENKLKKL